MPMDVTDVESDDGKITVFPKPTTKPSKPPTVRLVGLI
jgi:hypothetical protein